MAKTPSLKFILAALLLSVSFSLWQLIGRIIMQENTPVAMPLHSLTSNFIGLEKIFHGLPRAGYYSDKNMDIPLAVAQFEQAQYVLVPTVLELNNTSLPLVIFDCTTPAIAMAKIKELGFKPLLSNNGIILGLNPAYKK